MISLAYSMNYAGCPSTAMSLWKVDEKSNTQIIDYFFKEIEKGVDRSEALRNAKLKFLSKVTDERKAPFYWAGMVLMGKDGPIKIKSNPNSIFIFLLALGVLFLFSLRKKVFK